MRILIFVFIFTFLSINSWAQQDLIFEPILDKYRKSANLIPPYELKAHEETRSIIPGLLTDSARDEESGKIESQESRKFNYGFHRTLESLDDISNKTNYLNQLQEMMKSQQVIAFVTAAQTQPAAAAGLHYGVTNTQLTLINQQLSHQSYFTQLSHMPHASKLLQSMYTGCLYEAMSKGNSFAEAHRACIGDKGEKSSGENAEIAKATDIVDHPDSKIKPDIQDKPENKIYCTDIIFNQQTGANVENFKKDFKDWFGDELITISKIESGSAAGIARERVPPKEPLIEKLKSMVDERFFDFTTLARDVCSEKYEDTTSSNDKEKFTKYSGDNPWTKEIRTELTSKLTIEGYSFNTKVAESMIETFYDISNEPGKPDLQCKNLYTQCHKEVYKKEDGHYKYNIEGAKKSDVSRLCKYMHDYSEAVAVAHLAETISRVRRIILDFTTESQNSDARECGWRIIHDQLKTNDIDEVQYKAIGRLVQVGQSIFKDRSNESGITANSVGAGIKVGKAKSKNS